jgi:hypothetical protein
VDEREALSETVEAVSGRWCGHGRAVEPIPEGGSVPPDEPSGSGG